MHPCLRAQGLNARRAERGVPAAASERLDDRVRILAAMASNCLWRLHNREPVGLHLLNHTIAGQLKAEIKAVEQGTLSQFPRLGPQPRPHAGVASAAFARPCKVPLCPRPKSEIEMAVGRRCSRERC
jgi:hypothetical protein